MNIRSLHADAHCLLLLFPFIYLDSKLHILLGYYSPFY